MTDTIPPRIELDYHLTGKLLDWSTEFLHATTQFVKTHEGEEAAKFEVKFHAGSMFVKIGKNVLDQLSYAEIDHEVEPMREEIIAGRTSEARDVFVRSYLGHRLSGDLPDPE